MSVLQNGKLWGQYKQQQTVQHIQPGGGKPVMRYLPKLFSCPPGESETLQIKEQWDNGERRVTSHLQRPTCQGLRTAQRKQASFQVRRKQLAIARDLNMDSHWNLSLRIKPHFQLRLTFTNCIKYHECQKRRPTAHQDRVSNAAPGLGTPNHWSAFTKYHP